MNAKEILFNVLEKYNCKEVVTIDGPLYKSIIIAMEEYKNESAISSIIENITSMKNIIDTFMVDIENEINENPDNIELKGVKFGYKIASSQFKNRFNKYLM